MRAFLIKNFVLGTHVTIFGKTFHTLRSPRILFPATVITGLIVAGQNPFDWTIHWTGYVALSILALLYWVGLGNIVPFSYFKLFPVKMWELDDEQKYDFLNGIEKGILDWKNKDRNSFGSKLFDWEKREFERVRKVIFDKYYYNKRFAGLSNLLGLAIAIASIIIYSTLIVKI